MNRRQFLSRSIAASGTALLAHSARSLELPAQAATTPPPGQVPDADHVPGAPPPRHYADLDF